MTLSRYRKGVALSVAFGATSIAFGPPSVAQEPETLPVYSLASPTVDRATVEDLGALLNAAGSPRITQDEERFRLVDASKIVEVYISSGGFWVADRARLWNPELEPDLPDPETAVEIAASFFEQNLSELVFGPGPAKASFASVDGTRMAMFDPTTGAREDRQLDVRVSYSTTISVDLGGGTVLELPVVGGGGDFGLTIGEGEDIIGFNGVWRDIAGVEVISPVIPRSDADALFRELTEEVEIVSFSAELAYFSAPPSVQQDFLYPVYVYRSFGQNEEGERFPLRIITLPATEFGPELELQEPAQPRTEEDLPMRRTTTPEDGKEWRARKERKAEREREERRAEREREERRAERDREAGTSWIGLLGGLAGSKANAQGFVDGLNNDGWAINFNWGDEAAFESDWRRNDDSWVDAADFVFYTGHASMDSWVLSPPDDDELHFSEVGTSPESPGDLWGAQDLEWLIIAACGPLQDALLNPPPPGTSGGDVFERWDGAFDGLHLLLGYGGVTFDNEEEGETVVKYTTDGQTLINAWFRTATEVQASQNGFPPPDGPIIYVGVMYVQARAANPGNDHIHGHGSVATDPLSPDVYVAMWSPT
jgi:hypothetical protein